MPPNIPKNLMFLVKLDAEYSYSRTDIIPMIDIISFSFLFQSIRT